MRIPGSWSGHQAADLPLGVLGHALGLHQSVGWTMNWAASQKNAAHCQRSARIPSRPHPEVEAQSYNNYQTLFISCFQGEGKVKMKVAPLCLTL